MRQQVLARMMDWDKSRLSHQLTRMQNARLLSAAGLTGKLSSSSLPNSAGKGWMPLARYTRPQCGGICCRD